MLEDIIDSVLKSPEHNVELPTNFESEPNDQQIQVRRFKVELESEIFDICFMLCWAKKGMRKVCIDRTHKLKYLISKS